MEKRNYPQQLSVYLKTYLWILLLASLYVVYHNVMEGVRHPFVGIDMLCILLRIILNIADIIGLVLILRCRGIGVWVVVATAFFSILLSLAYPNLMHPVVKYVTVVVKLALLLLLFLRRNNLTGYQTTGLAKIEGKFIDEWQTGHPRYY